MAEDSSWQSFLGDVIELCIVTPDHKKTIRNLTKLGIGPWRVYTFTPENTTNQTYHGQPSQFSLKVCFAELPGNDSKIVYEVIQPVAGPNIFSEFLAKHKEYDNHNDNAASTTSVIGGIHHVAYDLNGIPFEKREEEFRKRGFKMTQGGSWMGVNHFAFFEAANPADDPGTCFETIAFPDDWVYPEPDEWYPSKPAGEK